MRTRKAIVTVLKDLISVNKIILQRILYNKNYFNYTTQHFIITKYFIINNYLNYKINTIITKYFIINYYNKLTNTFYNFLQYNFYTVIICF